MKLPKVLATLLPVLCLRLQTAITYAADEEVPLYDLCETEDMFFPLGSCMLAQECDLYEGIVSGTCAGGLGACCIVRQSCGSTTSLNNTYFMNSATPAVGPCGLTVQRTNEDICQVRLDFQELQLAQPDNDGFCYENFLAVTGEITTVVPTICGINDGQHIYIDVVPNGGDLEVIIDVVQFSFTSPSWRILVQQIGCDSRYRAPEGCLQYFTTKSGNVRSFNYGGSGGGFQQATSQLADQHYGVCIKNAPNYCGITWERDQSSRDTFTVSGCASSFPPELLGDPSVSITGATDCYNDYIVIPRGVGDTGLQADRYCGLGFPNTVTSTATPFMLYVNTDPIEMTEVDDGNSGFSLNYRQITDCQSEKEGQRSR